MKLVAAARPSAVESGRRGIGVGRAFIGQGYSALAPAAATRRRVAGNYTLAPRDTLPFQRMPVGSLPG